MIKSFKIRLYPTKEQENSILEHINACRYIWNYMLARQIDRYNNGYSKVSGYEMVRHITSLKKSPDHSWLNNVSCSSLQIICADLEKAYRSFFNNTSNFPRFKSKKSAEQKYPLCTNRIYFIDNHSIQIQKLGIVKMKTDYSFPIGNGAIKFINPRIKNVLGKWMLSFSMECENQAQILSDKLMGIDLGIKELATVAFDNEKFVFHNINKSKIMRDLERRIRHTQHNISRKYEANKQNGKYIKTKNIIREENKLRKLYARKSNIQMDYIHKITHTLVSLLPKRVVMEDLDVLKMMNNHHISRYVSEQCFNKFRHRMEYKCEWAGIEFTLADRYYPSSKTCSVCGNVKKDLRLSDRVYICPKCGLEIDRDYNAAVNLMRYIAKL